MKLLLGKVLEMLSPEFEKIIFTRPRGACRQCGETAPAAITKSGLCYECDCRRRGQTTVEDHHLRGRAHPETTDLPGNPHKVISEKERVRDPLLKQSSDNPLLEAARIVAIVSEQAETINECKHKCKCDCHSKWREQFIAFIAKAGKWVVNILLALAGFLLKKFGENWHHGFSFPRFS